MRKTAPKIKRLLENIIYIGPVESTKKVNYVFQTGKDYLLFSYKGSTYRDGYFNIIEAETIERIFRIFKGLKLVTSRDIKEHPRIKKFATRFDVLRAMYVMVALKHASINKQSLKRKKLLFNFKN